MPTIAIGYPLSDRILHSTDTKYGHYEIWELDYDGRYARVLFNGKKDSAQSGIPLDGKAELLFDYNQRIEEIIESSGCKDILLIGGGVYTLPSAITHKYPDVHFDIVEIDAELHSIAERYFEFVSGKQMNVYHGDGHDYLTTTNKKYDAIIIDAYEGTRIPSHLMSLRAIKSYRKHLNGDGILIVNIISGYFGQYAVPMCEYYERSKKIFDSVHVYPASRSLLSYRFPQNFVMIAQRGEGHVPSTIYHELEPPSLFLNT